MSACATADGLHVDCTHNQSNQPRTATSALVVLFALYNLPTSHSPGQQQVDSPAAADEQRFKLHPSVGSWQNTETIFASWYSPQKGVK